MQTGANNNSPAETRAALRQCRPGLIGIGLLTGTLALLPIAAAIYVLMLLDVVMAGRSGATLAGLFIMIVLVYGMQSWLSLIRDRLFVQVGTALTQLLGGRLDRAIARSIETTSTPGDGLQASRDLDAVRQFLDGRDAAAFCDIAALPLIVLVMVVLHGFLALALLIVAAIMLGVLWLTLRAGQEPARARGVALADRNVSTEIGLRHAELIRVLGMAGRATLARQANDRRLASVEQDVADMVATRVAIARALRLIGGATMLGVGTWLGIEGKASVGVIVAAALLADRALRPIEDAIAASRELSLSRQGWKRIGSVLANVPADEPPLPLPAPRESLAAEGLTLAAPGSRRLVLRDISFTLSAGDMLTIGGGSAVGKSALLRALVGGWRPAGGQVRIDGAALGQWDPLELGHHIGYLPQTPELFDGTVAQNIARFDPQATAETVIAASTAAGLHDAIVRLPNGYETEIGTGGNRLSLGERQRIALARALYGDPFILALDEPAAHADAVALAALSVAVRAARQRGAIVVVVGSAQATLDPSNLLLVLRAGQIQEFGPKDAVRAKLIEARNATRPRPATAAGPAGAGVTP